MRSLSKSEFLLTLCVGLTAFAARAADDCASLSPAQAAELFDEWNLTLSTLDAEKVAQRYWPDAVLLPTASNTPRTNPAMVRDYFMHFLANHPRGRIDTRTVQSACNIAIDAGTYTFQLMDAKGRTSDIAARYTFVYQYRDGAWKIAHHHSSAMPEKPGSEVGLATQTHDSPANERAAADATAPGAFAGNVSGEARPRAVGGTRLFLNTDVSPPVGSFYPEHARERREQGTVAMKVCAGPKGNITGEPEILETSGSPLLDSAAQAWAQAAIWIPATLNSKPIEGCTQISVMFTAPKA